MKVLLFLFITLSLYASQSLVDVYQKEGSDAIEKIFDKELSSQQSSIHAQHEKSCIREAKGSLREVQEEVCV